MERTPFHCRSLKKEENIWIRSLSPSLTIWVIIFVKIGHSSGLGWVVRLSPIVTRETWDYRRTIVRKFQYVVGFCMLILRTKIAFVMYIDLLQRCTRSLNTVTFTVSRKWFELPKNLEINLKDRFHYSLKITYVSYVDFTGTCQNLKCILSTSVALPALI